MKPTIYTVYMVTVYLYDMKYIRDISPRSNKRQKIDETLSILTNTKFIFRFVSF